MPINLAKLQIRPAPDSPSEGESQETAGYAPKLPAGQHRGGNAAGIDAGLAAGTRKTDAQRAAESRDRKRRGAVVLPVEADPDWFDAFEALGALDGVASDDRYAVGRAVRPLLKQLLIEAVRSRKTRHM